MRERYDAVVGGGTPGGIATAVRAAREGVDTLVVAYGDHLGGMMSGGLSYTDTLTKKTRAPILEEFVAAVRDHYADEYGRDSSQYESCEDGYVFEPHVAEETFEALVGAEEALDVRRGFRPVAAERANERVRRVRFEPTHGGEGFSVAADIFVEATYEGDLMATVGVPYRVGRESREEFGEQFAGELYTGIRGDRFYPREAVGPGDDSAPADRRGPLDVPPEKRRGDLDLIPHPAGLTEVYPKSTGRGDDAIQAYNYRLCLSRDPENRRRPERPATYDREAFLGELDEIVESGLRPYLLLRYLPNEKADMNAADLPGENHDYPEAVPDRRREIARRHREHALGLLYFLQNDEAVPAEIREAAREWGLARDEFEDSDNFPPQFYVREARRLDGRYVFSEGDARHAVGLDRTPVHADAIAVAEYPLDSHACRTKRQTGSQREGFFYASQVTRPSQVPYRSLLPRGVDNLLVPVPLSATHVAYGTIRLEPTWMHIGESAGVAVALAAEADRAPADLDPDAIRRRLVERGALCSFFNDHDAATDEPWVPAVQFLGAKGFFDSYDARADEPLSAPVAEAWARLAGRLAAGDASDPTDAARRLPEPDGTRVDPERFVARLDAEFERRGVDRDGPGAGDLNAGDLGGDDGDGTLTRGEACRLVYDSLNST